ncbi:MAG: type IV conjugative transfer system protein TraE [Legionellales bacterium]|jgi:type IV conjugative transfer system protein TraE
MIKGQYDSVLMQLLQARNRLVVILSGVIVVLFILLLILIPLSQKREQIVVLPDVVTEPFTISAKKVSASYLRQMGDYYTRLVYSVTPESVDAQIDTLLFHVPPQYTNEMKLELVDYADAVKQKNLMSSFYPIEFAVNEDKLLLDVVGEFIVFWGDEQVVSKKTLQVQFLYQQGRLWVQSITIGDIA